MKIFIISLLISLHAFAFDFQTCIDLIKGEWVEENMDIATFGNEPIQLKRTFQSDIDESCVFLNWAFNLPIFEKREKTTPLGKRFESKFDSTGRIFILSVVCEKTNEEVGWFQFDYCQKKCKILSSNGESVTYGFSDKNLLSYVENCNGRCDYTYKDHPTKKGALITQKKSSSGLCIQINYTNSGKIKEIFYSENGETPIQMALVEYYPGLTTVLDARKILTRYWHQENKIIKIETVLPDSTLYKYSEWEWQGKNLIAQVEKDGLDKLLIRKNWAYDSNNNLVEESIEGTLTGPDKLDESYKKFYFYDVANRLVKERSEDGFTLLYNYEKDTNNLNEKLVLDHEKMIERTFFKYDKFDRLIETWTEDIDDCGEPRIKNFEKIFGFNFLNAPLEICKGIFDLMTEEELVTERTLYQYDNKGRVIKESKYDANGTELEWSITTYNNGVKEILTSNGTRTLFSSQLKQVNNGEGEHRYFYSTLGKLIKEEHFNSQGTLIGHSHFVYDCLGQLSSKIENGNCITSYSYDCLGRKIQEVSPPILSSENLPISGSTYYSYDAMDRVIQIISADGSIKKMDYNARNQPFSGKLYYLNGQLKEERYQDGTFHNYDYDALGRVRKKILYDRESNPIHSHECFYQGSKLEKERFSSGITLFHEYDSCGRLVNSLCGETNRKVSYDYDLKGNLLNQKEYYEKDSFILKENVPNETVEPDSLFTLIQNELGQTVVQKTISHPNGTFSHIRYNALGHSDQMITFSPSGQKLSMRELRYDFNGKKLKEVLSSPNHKAEIINLWTYDSTGKLTVLIEGAGSKEERKTIYHYDFLGKLKSQTNNAGITLYYEYDNAGRISTLCSSDETIHYEIFYDSAGRISKVKDHLYQVESIRTYTLDGQVLKEQLANGLIFENVYDLLGRRTQLTLPDLSSINYKYENEHLVEIIRKNAFGETLYAHQYLAFDAKGRPLKAAMIKNLGIINFERNEKDQLYAIQSPYFEQNAEFDNQKRLISLKTRDSERFYSKIFSYDLQNFTEDACVYVFDERENLHSKNGKSFYSNSLNQIFSEETHYEYDMAGNLVKKISNGDIFIFAYDALGRMLKVIKNGRMIHQYTYDLFHRRLTDKTGCFLYDGNVEIGYLEESCRELRVMDNKQQNIAFEIDGNLYAPIHHINGSIGVVVNTASLETQSFSYNAFGEVNTSSNIPWLFSNKRYDLSTHLYHFGRRDYDPSLGRFITPDPIGFNDGMNRYAYCHNDPLNRFDWFGLQSDPGNNLLEEDTSFFQILKSKIINLFESFKKCFCLRPKEIFEYVSGNGFLLLSGYNSTERNSGYYGKGEASHKVRVSYINGILTEEQGLLDTVKALSESHGNVNIHYVYRPTKGWVRDILQGLAISLGFITEEAQLLASMWKGLIEEMGGVSGGGKIIHYGHSLGAKETLRALSQLSKEEQKLVHVYAFGSPSVATENPNYQVKHFVSIRDGVCLLDLVSFIQACRGKIPEVVFTGTLMGPPIIDHLFQNQTYQDIWRSMGRTFVEWYGCIVI